MKRNGNRSPCLDRRRAFTLVELLVAIVILLVVVLAVGKIFSTVSQVTAIGESTATFLQSSPSIERQIRGDIERMAKEGFLVIRNIAVRNDINRLSPTDPSIPLLDPALPEGAFLRADQILFFANGVSSTMAFSGSYELDASTGEGGNQQSSISRVYIGPAFQIRKGAAKTDPVGYSDGKPMAPWSYDFPGDPMMEMAQWPSPPFQQAGVVDGAQPGAAEWVLARQRVLLAHDGASTLFFNSNSRNSASSIWLDDSTGDWATTGATTASDNALRSGRVDLCGSTLNQIRRAVLYRPDGTARPWRNAADDQRTAMSDAVFYPRGERLAPSMLREDQMLVANTLGVGISSFAVDWTYDDGVGRLLEREGNVHVGNVTFAGMFVRPGVEQPWFGIADSSRNVYPLGTVPTQWGTSWGSVNSPIYSDAIERSGLAIAPYPLAKAVAYEASFGFNQYQAFDVNNSANADVGFTPLPSALRITMTVSDPKSRTESRRQIQFIVRLP